ncbi:MAG: class I SAM-dependent methyltransferase [Sporolactobacillus sp.]|jgi:putative AdoMet-dependent methyltransferase|nr:class I SAM-dependent methyltransferase [Sporolactobacillus sp.]
MGREFINMFDQWADHYDRSVTGADPEYRDVFDHYDEILEQAAEQARGTVLEFGTGTGNLSRKLIARGLRVIGVEPSAAMRVKTKEKVRGLKLLDGDFLNYPDPGEPIETIATSYAFHHLTDQEKERAIADYYTRLTDRGRIVIADTLYGSEIEKRRIFAWAKEKGYFRLLKDLQREYYPLRGDLDRMLRRRHFVPRFKQLNRFVWLVVADKID